MPRPIALVVLLAGCGTYDLPPGWEGAARLPVVQTECGGTPYEPHDERLEAVGARGRALLDLRETTFRCAQDVEAFAREGQSSLDVLVQPRDMNPEMVAACDCLYDVHVEVDALEPGPYSVAAFRRWDNWNDPNDPVPVGTADITVE
ncbi:MAG: hypothetical protein IT378_17010 [Sandaracinaceae bacterium]|nr:hypothetical protein [Sandaracinaceae bacterium]